MSKLTKDNLKVVIQTRYTEKGQQRIRVFINTNDISHYIAHTMNYKTNQQGFIKIPKGTQALSEIFKYLDKIDLSAKVAFYE